LQLAVYREYAVGGDYEFCYGAMVGGCADCGDVGFAGAVDGHGGHVGAAAGDYEA
jgi:hypothetical protein